MGRLLIAALFVIERGPYVNRPDVDAWTEDRDARKYEGPYPVIAHPPCERWGRYAGEKLGQDEGRFEAALDAVMAYNGVIEHPEGSHAFRHFKLPIPKFRGGWTAPDPFGGRSCCIAQGHYGHRARKMTWLYGIGIDFRELKWGPTPPRNLSHLPADQRARAIKTGICQRLSRRQRMISPEPFVKMLLQLVRK